jgi:hypothetical protein
MDILISFLIQDVPEGKFNIFGGHSIGQYNNKAYMYPFQKVLEVHVITRLKERQDELGEPNRRVFTQVTKCTDVGSEIFENVLH